MKIVSLIVGLVLLAALTAGVWVLRFHSNWVEPHSAESEEGENEKTQSIVPVHVAHVERGTVHRYIEAFGVIEPAPAGAGKPAGTADVASPVAGVVSKVLCQPGQQVKKGDTLIQLDDRLARAAEDQATAALNSARASLAKLKATPRPEQLEIARLAVEKAQSALAFAQRNQQRQKELGQGTSQKSLDAAEQDLRAAQSDLAVAQAQYALLKASPTPEEIADESAKVAGAEAALAAAKTQRSLLTITSPLDATVVAVGVHAGEAVDTTKVLVDLVALDRLVVYAQVPADQLGALSVGQSAEVIPAGLDKGVEGKVFFIGPEVDRKTNTAPAGIDVPPGLRPGQTVRVRIMVEEHKDVLVAPVDAVDSNEEGESFVAVVEGDQAAQRTVEKGIREGDRVEIAGKDLKEGMTIVSAGVHGLPEKTKIRIIVPTTAPAEPKP